LKELEKSAASPPNDALGQAIQESTIHSPPLVILGLSAHKAMLSKAENQRLHREKYDVPEKIPFKHLY
jgi:hypothetical protein